MDFNLHETKCSYSIQTIETAAHAYQMALPHDFKAFQQVQFLKIKIKIHGKRDHSIHFRRFQNVNIRNTSARYAWHRTAAVSVRVHTHRHRAWVLCDYIVNTRVNQQTEVGYQCRLISPVPRVLSGKGEGTGLKTCYVLEPVGR